MSTNRDHALGMDRAITRRDFLNGFSVAVGTSILGWRSPWLEALGAPDSSFAPEKDPNYYPPAKTGMLSLIHI